MLIVNPKVFFVAATEVLPDIHRYLECAGAPDWITDAPSDGEELVETAGRVCYRSFAPGLNPNITRVREGNKGYILNLLKQGHGSVLEHVQTSWILLNVSRVLTHELVRHRAGCAYSQESMRCVRVTEIPFWFPEWATEDTELMDRCLNVIRFLGDHQEWMAQHFGLDNNQESKQFSFKKRMTSFMRRFAPIGTATTIMLSANLRALRHIIAMRTSPGAEEEIRMVFVDLAEKAKSTFPNVFQDMTIHANGSCVFEYDKA